MTPAEMMAKTLDSVNCNLDGEYRDDIPEDAAALIRRLAAALATADKAMEKLSDGSTISEFRKVYADALREAKEEA